MSSESRHYRQAALAYLVYGLIYLSGAVYLTMIGESARGAAAGGIWWFLLGALMLVVFPVLVWKEFKWVTRILAVLVFVRVLGLLRMMAFDRLDPVPLPGGMEVPRALGAAAFALVASAACFFLVRAGWPGRFARSVDD